MKKTQVIDAIRNIKKSIISYLSLCLVVTLGIGGFLMCSEIIEGLKDGAMNYYDKAHFKDMEVISAAGFTEEDIEKVLRHEEILEAEGVTLCGGTLSTGIEKIPAELSTFTKTISLPANVEGRLPEAANECAIGKDLAQKANLSIGDTAEILIADTFSSDALKETTFIITGLSENPEYIRSHSTYHIYLPDAAWNKDVTRGISTRLYIRTDIRTDRNFFGRHYPSELDEQKKRLMPYFETLAADQKDAFEQKQRDLIHSMSDEVRAQLEASEKAIRDSEKKLAEGEETIKNAKASLLQAEQEAAAKIADAERQIAEGKEQLAQGKETLINGQWQYEAGLIELKDGEEKYLDGLREFHAAERALEEYRAEAKVIVEKGTEAWNYIWTYRKVAESYREVYPDVVPRVLDELDLVLLPSEVFYNDIAEITLPEVEALIDDRNVAEA